MGNIGNMCGMGRIVSIAFLILAGMGRGNFGENVWINFPMGITFHNLPEQVTRLYIIQQHNIFAHAINPYISTFVAYIL